MEKKKGKGGGGGVRKGRKEERIFREFFPHFFFTPFPTSFYPFFLSHPFSLPFLTEMGVVKAR